MREILFRGQTRRRGEKVKMSGEPAESNWVYGGIFPTENGDRAIIYQQEPEIKKYPVYADTVGQYTGLKDKNDKKIFEGDILGFYSNTRPVKVEWSSDEGKFMGVGNGCLDAVNFKEWDIIGNIYDNPELMEGRKQ